MMMIWLDRSPAVTSPVLPCASLCVHCVSRFQKALDSAKQGEDMWILLGSANIHDAKLRKVLLIAVIRFHLEIEYAITHSSLLQVVLVQKYNCSKLLEGNSTRLLHHCCWA